MILTLNNYKRKGVSAYNYSFTKRANRFNQLLSVATLSLKGIQFRAWITYRRKISSKKAHPFLRDEFHESAVCSFAPLLMKFILTMSPSVALMIGPGTVPLNVHALKNTLGETHITWSSSAMIVNSHRMLPSGNRYTLP